MGLEIERKYLLKNNKWKSQIVSEFTKVITQGYISSSKGKVVRVRSVSTFGEQIGFITIKGPTKGISRIEYEYEIPYEDARDMINKLCIDTIKKTRYMVGATGVIVPNPDMDDELYWEIDVFHAKNKGLVIAEIELPHSKTKYDIPEWISRDVTDQRKYSNSNLIKAPYKSWNK
jgi:adenylate cyclase